MPQCQKEKQISFRKADVAFNSLTARARGYSIYFTQNMNAMGNILGNQSFG